MTSGARRSSGAADQRGGAADGAIHPNRRSAPCPTTSRDGGVDLAGSVIIPGADSECRPGRGRTVTSRVKHLDTINAPGRSGASSAWPRKKGAKNARERGGRRTMSVSATLKITLVWSDPPGPCAKRPRPHRQGVERREERQYGASTGFDRINNRRADRVGEYPPGTSNHGRPSASHNSPSRTPTRGGSVMWLEACFGDVMHTGANCSSGTPSPHLAPLWERVGVIGAS